ncbi:Glucosamine-6-phosphate deaminase 1 [Posidoniimonas corsicana]|uniref:Glucosamine-6-phosphate deaminase 1 n=1 Tax=Posidoniimonas corsicana TaxID=1938618 RepID=A0A5C5VF05_9BACT|nr:glucosamine-6-phosphate deaminase [Posidoniimonas corsicana]TWT36460.1 Glucosamine-6-phosphate deaminase 1 [Posidoniimonas corsicana]
MEVKVFEAASEAGVAAAREGAERIRRELADQGEASIVLATGASQFAMLAQLVEEPGIDWSRVTLFHLDEYVGLPVNHPASFRGYLWQRFISKLPVPPRAYHLLNGEADPAAECQRLGDIISQQEICVAFVGIGENGHLAFNDPPADFDCQSPFLVVELDEACRTQQWREGWFDSLESVPSRALSMSVPEILRCKSIVCTVPDRRKAAAVRASLEGEVTAQAPASALRRHPSVTVYLDEPAASLLRLDSASLLRLDGAEPSRAGGGKAPYMFHVGSEAATHGNRTASPPVQH